MQNNKVFLTKDFLLPYTERIIGVNNKKVKKLIKKLDLEYLRNQRKELTNWDFSKSKLPIVKYSGNPSNVFDKIRRYKCFKTRLFKGFKNGFCLL